MGLRRDIPSGLENTLDLEQLIKERHEKRGKKRSHIIISYESLIKRGTEEIIVECGQISDSADIG